MDPLLRPKHEGKHISPHPRNLTLQGYGRLQLLLPPTIRWPQVFHNRAVQRNVTRRPFRLKWDATGDTMCYIWGYQTPIVPTWGDVYWAGGNEQCQERISGWNPGFLEQDPYWAPLHCGPELGHILVTDTGCPPETVPVPGALVLVSIGLSLVGWLQRKRICQ